MGRLGTLLLGLVSGLIILFLLAPVAIVLVLSFSSAKFMRFPPPGFSLQWYEHFFATSAWTDAAATSLVVALAVTVLALLLGVPAAIGLVRGQFLGRRLVGALILSPIIVPGIIVAIGIYYAYAQYQMVGSPLALIVAHTCLAVPFVVITAATALSGVDPRLEQAARNLGASPVSAFAQVTLPLIRPGILAGAVFAFVTSFDELLVALFISGSTAVTLPRRMWDQIRFEIEPTIAAASTLLIVLTVALMLTAELLRRRAQRLRTRPLD
jgi:putative spermidine/putrescine transport system permease protein